METLVSDARFQEDHFHDASKHGLTWAFLNELLHVIVFVYTLYGMIQFKVKFIRREKEKFLRTASMFIIAHSWYVTVKFAGIAAILYLFNDELESRTIAWSEYNCSLTNHLKVFEQYKWRMETNNASESGGNSPDNPTVSSNTTVTARIKFITDYFVEIDYPLWYANFLEKFGGPFKLMGNRSTLMYGFYTIAFYIMLAIFPLELMYRQVGFNYIRFVLSDASCMRELYINRKRHLDRLTSWSRNQTDSELTLGTKIALNQRDLRSRHADDCNELAVQLVLANLAPSGGGGGGCGCSKGGSPVGVSPVGSSHVGSSRVGGSRNWRLSQQERRAQASRMATTRHKLTANVRPLRPRLAINHLETPSYAVKVANRNLETFKPFVRSESWFKFAMIIYPMFIFFYFTLMCAVVGTVSIFFHYALRSLSEHCELFSETKFGYLKEPNLTEVWSNWDYLLFFETQYSVMAISCASSFYCSYYFGTILELFVWVQEISQQLDLCKIIIEIIETDSLNHLCHSLLEEAELDRSGLEENNHHDDDQANSEFVLAKIIDTLKEQRENQDVEWRNYHLWDSQQRLRRHSRSLLGSVNHFGGLNGFWTHWKLARFAGQSTRFKALELMAIKLLNKKQTLLRATYINMCLFFDELNDTRFMTRTILRRTTQIVFGFSVMASLTRSQFQANYWHLTLFLGACLIILNMYLACAAIINSSVSMQWSLEVSGCRSRRRRRRQPR